MSYIAIVRFPSGRLKAIVDGDDECITEWPTEKAAEDALKEHILWPMGIQFVEI